LAVLPAPGRPGGPVFRVPEPEVLDGPDVRHGRAFDLRQPYPIHPFIGRWPEVELGMQFSPDDAIETLDMQRCRGLDVRDLDRLGRRVRHDPDPGRVAVLGPAE